MAKKQTSRARPQGSYQKAMQQPTQSRPAPLAQSRNPMRVVQAQRQIAVQLPDAIKLKGSVRPLAERGKAPNGRPLPSLQPAKPKAQGEAKRSPRRDQQPTRSGVDLQKPLSTTCKARPDSNRKSGAGPSRPFVPWCNRG